MHNGNISPMSAYYKDASGGIRIWTIRAEDFEIVMEHGKLGGSMQTKIERVHYGIGGRSRIEQLKSRFRSRVKSKLDKGYTNSLEGAKMSKPVNSLGLLKPMLAAKWNPDKPAELHGALAQYKYDGHRCIITKHNGKAIAYSRNGKPINTISHILCDVKLEEGQFIDGELYIHGQSLQGIGSLVKKIQPGNSALRFYAYDLMDDAPYPDRLEELKSMNLGPGVSIAESWLISKSLIDASFIEAKSKGYEGIIIRLDGYGYQDGKRSKSLLKVKEIKSMPLIEDEFLVIDIIPSVDGWARLVCLMPSGKEFRVSAPGTMKEKMSVVEFEKQYIGRFVNVEFPNLTDDGKPFHPIAKYWRDKAQE